MRHDDGDEERRRCGLCGKILRPYDSISVAEVGERCYRCFNEELADRLGIDFDNTPIAPIVVTDVDGVRHRFEIRSMLVGTGHAMSAREVRNRDGGRRLSVRDPRRSRGRRPGPVQALARANPPGAQRSTRPADRARVAAHAGAPAQWRHRVGLRDRRCAPASHRRWPNVHLGSDRPHADDVRGLHAERDRGGHHRGRRRPACRWSTREPGLA